LCLCGNERGRGFVTLVAPMIKGLGFRV
jgi:hypothetical protein